MHVLDNTLPLLVCLKALMHVLDNTLANVFSDTQQSMCYKTPLGVSNLKCHTNIPKVCSRTHHF